MKLPRLDIRMLMIVVGIVGVDLAAGIALLKPGDHFWYKLGSFLEVAPIALFLEFAAVRAFLERGPARAFWVGFLVVGSAMAGSVVHCYVDPSIEKTTFHADGSRTEDTYPGGISTRAWSVYFGAIYGVLERLDYPYLTSNGGRATDSVLSFVPQVLLAWIGGLSTRRMLRLRRKPPEPPLGTVGDSPKS